MPLTNLERKAQLVLRQVKQVDLAKELGVSETHVSQIIAGERRSKRIEQAIADAIEMPVGEVFEPATEAA